MIEDRNRIQKIANRILSNRMAKRFVLLSDDDAERLLSDLRKIEGELTRSLPISLKEYFKTETHKEIERIRDRINESGLLDKSVLMLSIKEDHIMRDVTIDEVLDKINATLCMYNYREPKTKKQKL